MTAPPLEDSALVRYPPLFPDSPFDLVVIAASAGGVDPVKQVIQALPADFPASVAVVQHIGSLRNSMMAEVLGFRARMPVRFAVEGERLRAATVRVAPAGVHLVISPQRRFALEASAKVNYVRPAADRLFTTAAAAFGARVIAVVMSGMGRDGCEGAEAVKAAGGLVLAQDPQTSQARGMPESVIDSGVADLAMDVDGVARALVSLVTVHGTRAWLGLPRARRSPARHRRDAPFGASDAPANPWSIPDFR